ncbi:hypothetical protein H2200_007074 [Cladophialophora chaetospira]|uniref:Uncharacterized protein n=1 Tax=Cladophialophora chaetospira TaxID=386627 RepID=A0AA38X7K4_9EURO|nr:hypothetical protein H2200_007074 [Cladophialophora chaetospira]
MAPSSLKPVPRQFNGDDRFGRNQRRASKWMIIGIVIAVLLVASITGLLIFRRLAQRRRFFRTAINLTTTTANKPVQTGPALNDPSRYAGGAGYTATADQNQSLLGHAETPAIVTWDPSHSENAGSTQDGFGYDNNLHLTGGIQRPASVASFSAPPPRYEEALSAPGSSSGRRLQSQGEAASYFNAAVPLGDERGRSRSREAADDSRGRALSAGTRSINTDRRRSISRFREEGMVEVTVGKN